MPGLAAAVTIILGGLGGGSICDTAMNGPAMREHPGPGQPAEEVDVAKATLEERFWASVEKTETCWLWTGGSNGLGYGRFAIRLSGESIRQIYAHRFAYELIVGPIPDGLTLDHLCHNADETCLGGTSCLHRRCVNPAHLEPATSRENTFRSPMAPAAANATKVHCPSGHPYDETNTYVTPEGWRHCRICARARTRAWKARRKS